MPARLRSLGYPVIVHDEEFAPDARDEEWLAAAGRARWIALTQDQKIRYREGAKAVVRKHGVALFVVSAANSTGQEVAEIVGRAARRIVRFTGRNDPPFIARIYQDGSVRMVADLK
ncbi:MAG: hypothetical protein FJY73_13935 [Candidatus Eisenbacteria bacterium]|nr:hypothetical protein [Candidatus Eisenbacteria bacterium]